MKQKSKLNKSIKKRKIIQEAQHTRKKDSRSGIGGEEYSSIQGSV